MIEVRWSIPSVFKDLYLPELREIRPQQKEFSIYLVEKLSPIQFNTRILEHCTGIRNLPFS